MTDLGAGVHERSEPYEGGPIGPMCPICPADKPHRVVVNEGRLGGYRCEGCGWCLTGDHREAQHPKNQRRRELWAEEMRPRREDG